MKDKFARAHMSAAKVYAKLSYCTRLKVGCVIVRNNTPIAIGYNGTPPGDENVCENTETGRTNPNVIHAEDNALRKLTASTESAKGATVFITAAPCRSCAERIVAAGVVKVYFEDLYRKDNGIAYLKEHNVDVEQII